MRCASHPELPAKLWCEKFEARMCERCMTCRSPKEYCKHREQCLIWKLLEEDFEDVPPNG